LALKVGGSVKEGGGKIEGGKEGGEGRKTTLFPACLPFKIVISPHRGRREGRSWGRERRKDPGFVRFITHSILSTQLYTI